MGEAARKSAHMATGTWALLLPFLGWPAMAILMVAALLFNLFFLPRLFPGFLRSEGKRRADMGIALYPVMVLALLLVFRSPPGQVVVVGTWGLLAFGDGLAPLAARRFGGPSLPWNRAKTWSGAAGFVLGGWLGAMALMIWQAAWTGALAWTAVSLLSVALCAAVVAAVFESLPLSLDDNVSVTVSGAAVLWLLLPGH